MLDKFKAFSFPAAKRQKLAKTFRCNIFFSRRSIPGHLSGPPGWHQNPLRSEPQKFHSKRLFVKQVTAIATSTTWKRKCPIIPTRKNWYPASASVFRSFQVRHPWNPLNPRNDECWVLELVHHSTSAHRCHQSTQRKVGESPFVRFKGMAPLFRNENSWICKSKFHALMAWADCACCTASLARFAYQVLPSLSFYRGHQRVTLPETNGSLLKMDGWNTILSYWGGLFSGANC